jgi:hypothetical protein
VPKVEHADMRVPDELVSTRCWDDDGGHRVSRRHYPEAMPQRCVGHGREQGREVVISLLSADPSFECAGKGAFDFVKVRVVDDGRNGRVLAESCDWGGGSERRREHLDGVAVLQVSDDPRHLRGKDRDLARFRETFRDERVWALAV